MLGEYLGLNLQYLFDHLIIQEMTCQTSEPSTFSK